MKRFATPFLAAALLVAGSAAAQTMYSFGAVLSGEQEVPPSGSPAVGVISVVFVDNPAPFPDGIVVGGGFDDLTGDYSASHLHTGAVGVNGPVFQGLAVQPGDDAREGEWVTDENTYASSASVLADLQAGLVYANVHSTTFPGGEIRGQLRPVPLLDGDVSDDLYLPLATKQNDNLGFGPNIDVTEIVYYPDLFNEVLFLGVKGKVNTASSDGFGIWLGFDGLSGRPAGQPLGGVPNAGHYMGDGANADFRADFEVDYMFALNPAGGADSVFIDVVSFVGDPAGRADYLGSADQSGTPSFGPPDDVDNSGNPATFNAAAFTFSNAGTGQTGFEIALPFADLGLSATNFTGGVGDLTTFATVVSSTAYFSNVTVPGNASGTADPGGNLGFNADFSALAGGPYNATAPLVVAGEPGAPGTEATISLSVPAPNPASGRTELLLHVERAQEVRAVVYDALGRSVRTIEVGRVAAGEARSVEVDAAGLPAGVYVVRVTGETFTASQRLTVVR